MREAFDDAIAQVRGNAPLVRQGEEPEAIHQLRVGVRRVRVSLRLFKRVIGEEERARLEPELRWIFQSLGGVRDYDVLLEQVDVLLPDAAPLARKRLHGALHRARAKAARTLQRELASARFRALVRALRRLSIALAANEEKSPRARKWSKKRLAKRLAAVCARRDALDGRDPEALHALRKDLKKLRYTADLVGSLWPGKRTKRYLRCLSQLQDVLGPINDAAVGTRLLAEAARTTRDAGAGRLATDAQAALSARSAASLAELAPVFEDFAQKRPFWR